MHSSLYWFHCYQSSFQTLLPESLFLPLHEEKRDWYSVHRNIVFIFISYSFFVPVLHAPSRILVAVVERPLFWNCFLISDTWLRLTFREEGVSLTGCLMLFLVEQLVAVWALLHALGRQEWVVYLGMTTSPSDSSFLIFCKTCLIKQKGGKA